MASTPILLVLVLRIAGLIAGSIPIIGIENEFLISFIAFVVAVLHATTIILQFISINTEEFFRLSLTISTVSLSP